MKTLKRLVLPVFSLLISLLMTSCIVPVNTTMESARMLGSGNVEVTGSFSSYSLSSEGESAGINDNIGLRVGYGVSDRVDLKVRYIRLFSSFESEDSPDVNYLAFIPKVSLTEKRFAVMAPFGMYFATVDGVNEDTWFVSPRLIYTYPLPSDKVEFSISSKADFYFEDDSDPSIGFTLGAGFSSDFTKWAIRPEVGLLFFTGDSEGTSFNFGIGGTILFGKN